MPPILLASASPRRAELLRAAGFDFEIRPAHVDEIPRPGEAAAAYTLRVAQDKARAAASAADGRIVLAADTEVVVDGDILGKPADRPDAAAMLRRLSARAHDVITAVVVLTAGQERSEIATTRVWFAEMAEDEIAAYVGTGEPMGKAGAYAIQGYAARFIERIDGSWSNVVGLPVHTVHRLLRDIL